MPDSFSCRRALGVNRKNILFLLSFALLFLLGLYFRTSGLFRGLGELGFVFHPDESKQIMALYNFLNGDYVRYYGSLFYDGYPYGLNHLDEYLLRPLLFFLNPDAPEYHSLYYHARLLRLAYSLAIMFLAYQLVYRLTHSRTSALQALLLIAIAPLPITVTHFATGDIGVDLFTALCFLFLLFYIDKRQKIFWLLCCGITIGAAFSAKYNGVLIGMVPAMVLFGQFLQEKQIRPLFKNCCILGAGSLIGILIFTPNILLDCKTTLVNIAANFKFIKNYNVPPEILAKSWFEKAYLGLQNNSLYIISSLGYTAFLSCLAGLIVSMAAYISCRRRSPRSSECHRNLYMVALALFPVLSLIIAMSGKYVVQPFHFSYLQLPMILVSCVLLSKLFSSSNILLKGSGLLLVLLLIFEFGRVSWEENFFWRNEDNVYHAENLPASIFDREAFFSHPSDTIRSLFLEAPGNSIFRNHRVTAKGPDAHFWNTIALAPLPQVANPIGKNWIFLNGPTFPRNERMLIIQGEGHGKTIKRNLVLPAGQTIAGLGIQSGSYATEVLIVIGDDRISTKLEAHQQKIVEVEPRTWRVSGEGDKEIHIIPLTISVPHNTLWVTILTSEEEKQLYTLFGGGQSGVVTVPKSISEDLKVHYFEALSRIQYLEHTLSWRVTPGKEIPMWEVALPAGRYTLTFEVDGLVDESEVALVFEDARGETYRGKQQSFIIKKGIQRLEYSFSKAFAPYQTRLVIQGKKGRCQMLLFKVTPDYHKLSDDFDIWRAQGRQPDWISRFGK
jgi:hypothetical protein